MYGIVFSLNYMGGSKEHGGQDFSLLSDQRLFHLEFILLSTSQECLSIVGHFYQIIIP